MKKIGDKVTVLSSESEGPVTGTIININLEHRHFTVRLPGRWCETFKLEELQ